MYAIGYFTICKELVEKWEPVYEDEYKVGAYITTISTSGNCSQASEYLYPYTHAGHVLQIIGKGVKDKYDYFICSGGYCVYNMPEYIRKSTPQEIKDYIYIRIGGYPVEFCEGHININSDTFQNSEIGFLVQFFVKHNATVKTLNVGCKGQYTVDLGILIKILNRLKYEKTGNKL